MTASGLLKAASAATSAALKATEAMAGGIESVKVAKGRAPRGVLQLHEMVGSSCFQHNCSSRLSRERRLCW
jgi:hypothetical protein